MEKLSLSQRELLLAVGDAPEGLVVQNNSTAAASLARKGLVTKELTKRKPIRAPFHGRQPVYNTSIARALLQLTESGREWLQTHGKISETLSVGVGMARNLDIEHAARRLAQLGTSLRDGIRVQDSYDRTLAELVALCAEESYIVKAARVLARSPYTWTTLELDSDLGRLMAEIARAGAPPYEQGTGTETEDDWVAPLRAELTQRNR